MEIGKDNTLRIARRVDFGLYLADADGNEVLLPTRYVPDAAQEGDELTVFVYHDNEGRPIATTDRPAATVGEFARMRVRQVAAAGAHRAVLPPVPDYLTVELEKLSATLVRLPRREEVPVICDVQMVVEYYSR